MTDTNREELAKEIDNELFYKFGQFHEEYVAASCSEIAEWSVAREERIRAEERRKTANYFWDASDLNGDSPTYFADFYYEVKRKREKIISESEQKK